MPSALVPEAPRGQRIHVVCSIAREAIVPLLSRPPVLEIQVTPTRGEPAPAEQRRIDQHRVDGSALGRPGRECVWSYVNLDDQAIRSLSLTLKGGGRDVWLEGLTLVRKDRDAGDPIPLGKDSMVGVPTGILAADPTGLGVVLGPASTDGGPEHRQITLPELSPPLPSRIWGKQPKSAK